MLTNNTKLERGDTIIEVLLALAILGIIMTTIYGIMTKSMNSGYTSLDRTTTQAMISGQAAQLRAVHAAYTKAVFFGNPTDALLWGKIRERVIIATTVDTTARDDGCSSPTEAANKRFWLDLDAANNLQIYPANIGDAVPISRPDGVTKPTLGKGIWVEGYSTKENGQTVMDFYIKACTPPIYGDGSNIQRQTKTVVRLYDI